jgi:hypothetical protein
VTGEQLYDLWSSVITWGGLTIFGCVAVVSIAYVRGRRKL